MVMQNDKSAKSVTVAEMPEVEHPRMIPSERREQIIKAAISVIAHHGYWGFSMRQVAEECNLTEPAVVYHFKSKVKLLIAVLEHRDRIDMENFANHLGIHYDDVYAQSAQFGLYDITMAFVERNALQPELVQLYTIMQGEAISQKHPAHEYYQAREKRVLAMFERAACHDGIENPRSEALQVLSQMDGLQIRWLRDPAGVDFVGEWKNFADARWVHKS